MTHALSAAYDPSEHPHAPAGSSTGGQFAQIGNTAKKAATKSAKSGMSRSGRSHTPSGHPARKPDDGTMSYDPKSNRGTGYDNPDGDPRVKKLQEALTRLGLTDSAGKPLKLDGKLGPKTTAAVRKAQHRMGVPVDGKVTPALLQKLAEAKTITRAAAPMMPYGGDVSYADPGYQPDKKKRYPLDSEEHCRAAWSYINMPKNAAMYTAEQLATIKAKMQAAGKKYGIDFAGQVKAAAVDGALRGVELARPGAWKLSSGDVEFTEQMLRDAADFFAASGGQAVPVKLGHTDNRFNGDGEPAFGSVTNVRFTTDDRGPVLLGDIVDMPQWLGAAAPKRWPNRSIEGWQNFSYDGREYSLILSGLAFLGVTPPGVKNIKSLADLQVALAASSATRLVASAPPDDPAEPPDDEVEDLGEEDDDEPDDGEPDATELQEPIPTTRTPAHPAGVSHVAAQAAARIHNAPVRGAGMNLAKYREALAGLPDDASEEEIAAALAAAGLASEPVGESTQELDQRVAAAAAKGGLVTIDPAQLQEFRDAMVRASALTKRLETQDRDSTITDAIKMGKFPPARRQHYERYWDADPVGAKEVIASLAANLVPVTASGYDTDADRQDDELDREIARLSPPKAKVA